MTKNFRNKLLIVALFNCIIALGFYYDNINSGYSVLINDVHSIIGIGHKFDNPTLFEKDLFLNTIDNVAYYTPFFVQPMRFFADIMNGDYLQGLSVFGLLAHIVFGLLWYLLFYRFTKSFWIAFLMSIFIKGIVWLPGGEIWGIGDVWSIMPRTIYITLMPLPFLIVRLDHKLKLLLSAFLIGLVFNFHPISGLGGIILYLSCIILYYVFFKVKLKSPIITLLQLFVMIILGMLPFIITYFTQTDSKVDYDVALYEDAFAKRIPSYFGEPLQFLKQWLNLKTLFFVSLLVLYLIKSRRIPSEFKKAKILVISTIVLVFLPSIAVYIENAANAILGLNLRMAFQFIRLQKLAILPAYFALAFLLVKFVNYKKYLPIAFSVFIFIALVCKAPVCNSIPLLGDDIIRSIVPKSLSIIKGNESNFRDIDKMMDYISKNTTKDDVFIGPAIIRSATKRSIVLDYKGASAIIEGNPKQFIQWYVDRTAFEALEDKNSINFLKSKGVHYILVPVKKDYNGAFLKHKIGKWHLYRIR